jgi:ABC-2 type transport system permease protein
MPIAERGYIHWQGTLAERPRPWRTIARHGIRLAFKRKNFKFVLGASLLPALVFMAGVYVSERIEDFKFMMRGRRQILAVNPDFFNAYFSGEFLLFMIVMILVLAGAGLISDDLKHNSLQLYFARPLRKRDYLLGKMGVVSFFLILLTLLPGTLFILLKLIFSGSLKFLAAYPWIPVSVAAVSAVLTVFFSVYALFISSLGRNRRYVSILLFLVYLFSDIFFSIFHGIFHRPAFALLSIKANLQQVSAALFGLAPKYDVPWLYSALILGGLTAAAVVVLLRKVRSVEVIR